MSQRVALKQFAWGASLGIAIAVVSVVSARESRAVPRDAVALVNGVPVSRTDHAQALAALASARDRGVAAANDARIVRDRLIDQELLLQRALELDLPRRDPRLRNELVTSLIESVLEREAKAPPTEEALRAYYHRHQAELRGQPRVRIEQRFFAVAEGESGASARERARGVAAALARGEAVRDAGDTFFTALPEEALSATQWESYLGPTVARTLSELPVATWSEPVRSGRGVHLVRVLARESGILPSFESVRAELVSAYERDAADERLEAYLRELRAAAEVQEGELP